MSTFKRMSLGIAAACLAFSSLTAAAQSDYPTQEVRWIIPWNPGGSNDIMARVLQPILAEHGLPVYVENIAGGTGAVGMSHVANAAPDGYTIGMGTSSTLAIMAQGQVDLTNDDFDHIIRVSIDPLMLLVNSGSAHETLEDFIADMGQRPGEVTIATPGTNNLNHLFAAMTARGAEVDYRHVPYPGGSQVVSELMGNQIEAGVLKPSETLEAIRSGALRPLGVFATERLDILPDIPTFEEAGIDVFPYGPVVQMAYIDAPAGTPAEVRQKLEEAFEAALNSEQFQQFANTNGFFTDPIKGDEFDAEVNSVGGAIADVAEQVFTN